MEYIYFPLETLLNQLKRSPELTLPVAGGGVVILVLLALAVWHFRKYFAFVSKSLFRNLLRTALTSVAIMVLVFVVTLVCSFIFLLDVIMTEKTKDLKAVVTERWQIPSQMPISYAVSLEDGGARPDHPEDVRPQDTMAWQFFGGTLDPTKMTRENLMFLFAMDPEKIKTMMDDLEGVDDSLIQSMKTNKKGMLIGRDRLAQIQNHVGGRFVLTGMNFKDLKLEFDILGTLPEGRYDQSAIMNRAYLNDALDVYAKEHKLEKHPATRSLNLFWLRVPDTETFRKMAGQIETSSLFSAPAVKCETASSGIASWLDPYKDLFWGVKWLLVPALLSTMALIIANAISISVRERRTEMAVLKVLGYGPGRIMAFVLGEAILIGALSGFLVTLLSYLWIHVWMKGIKFPIAFFPIFDIRIDALWWGLVAGAVTALIGSILPALSARRIKVSEVFAKIG